METLQTLLFLVILLVLAMLLRNMYLKSWQQHRDLTVPEKDMRPVEVVVPSSYDSREAEDAERRLKAMLEQEQMKSYVSLDAIVPDDNGLIPVDIM